MKKLFSQCPALKSVINKNQELAVVLEKLIANDLQDVFGRYLSKASEELVLGFLNQLAQLDLHQIQKHRQKLGSKKQQKLTAKDVEPVQLITLEEQAVRNQSDREAGQKSLKDGRWASIAFSGGAGTRFFSKLDTLKLEPQKQTRIFDSKDPKGLFPISPVGGLRFYDIFIAEALATGLACGRLPLVLFLSSELTHDRTIEHLSHHPLWGFPKDGWRVFQQAADPRLDKQKGLVVSPEGDLVKTGDGHGGVFRALLRENEKGPCLLDELVQTGIEQLILHNVDNAAARPFAPTRLGFHMREQAHFTLSAARKIDPDEQVGVLVRLRDSGKVEVVEYNVIDPGIAQAQDTHTGRLLHEAGNINTNLVAVDSIRAEIEPTLYTGKVVPSYSGPVETSSLEMLNQHITRRIDANKVRAYEIDRDSFFMPTKNVTGEDSVASTVKTLSKRYAKLLTCAGATVASDALCDLHPICAENTDKLRSLGIGSGWKIGPGSRLYLCAHTGSHPGQPPFSSNLTLEAEAGFIVDAQFPVGAVGLLEDRRIQTDLSKASRVAVGRNVCIRSGVQVTINVGPACQLKIPDNADFTHDLDLHLTETQEIFGS
jgi:UDP-N-acetylglucosamine pyrophosphorylase